ncbi:MAG: ribosomal RNA small subunit methyltransferase A [Dehalococcoidia bacterium]|nr:ribosomal RNA small subunit methyltransferase A [Dehalococcoidia bacterium]
MDRPAAPEPSGGWPDPSPASSFRPKKRLGQHFLVNRGILGHILDSAELQTDDLVVEIGPGPGVLTRALLEWAGQVVAVEVDRELAAKLTTELAGEPRFRLVQGDVLSIPVDSLLHHHPNDPCPRYKVVANLPYYITAPILRTFLTAACPPQRLVVMVQLEVARSIVGSPGKLGLLGVAVQYYGRPHIVCEVSPGSFFPPPQVRSAVLTIDVYGSRPVAAPDAETFFRVVRAGFSTPRKQLHNALSNGLNCTSDRTHQLLETAGIDPKRRAETLSLAEWGRVGLCYQSVEA